VGYVCDNDNDKQYICSLPALAGTLAPPQRDGQAELTRLSGCTRRLFTGLNTLNHSDINCNRYIITTLNETNFELLVPCLIVLFYYRYFTPLLGCISCYM